MNDKELKELAREKINLIRELSRKQDCIYDNLVDVLNIKDDIFKKDWLFDVAFNGCDFDSIWEEKLK